eukprot:2310343-Rhodomonas_salina.1
MAADSELKAWFAAYRGTHTLACEACHSGGESVVQGRLQRSTSSSTTSLIPPHSSLMPHSRLIPPHPASHRLTQTAILSRW